MDTIVCLDGSEVIGAFLARHLAKKEVFSVNSNKNINVVTPEYDSNGQLIFRDNLTPHDRGAGGADPDLHRQLRQERPAHPGCVQYYGGKVQGIAAIFSMLEQVDGIPVYSLFSPDDIAGYISSSPRSAPCAGPARRSMPWPTVSACPCCDPRLLSCIPRMHDFYTYLFIFLCIIFIFGESKRNIFVVSG